MQLMVCTEKSGWNVQLKEVEAAGWEELAKEVIARFGTGAQFPFTYEGEEYTVFYDDEIFIKDKEQIVAALYICGDAAKSYREPDGPDLVFGDFVLVKGHAHDGVLEGLSNKDVVALSAFIMKSDSTLKEMRKAKLFRENERIRPYVVRRKA